MPRRTAVAVFVLFALLATACGDGDATSAESGSGSSGEDVAGVGAETSSDSEYVARVDAVMYDVSSAIRELVVVLEGTYAEQTALFAAFSEAELGVVLRAAADDAADLNPPASFVDDNAVLLAVLGEAAATAEGVDEAIEEEDLLGTAAGLADLRVLQGTITQQVSPELCEAVSVDLENDGLDEFGHGLCRPIEEVGDSEWAKTTAEVARRYVVQVLPRIAGLEPSFRDEDTFAYLALIQPEVERILDELRDAQSALEPPEDHVADQQILVAFYDDLGQLAGRITVAARTGDGAALPALFRESGTIFDTAGAALSEPGLAVVFPMFSIEGT